MNKIINHAAVLFGSLMFIGLFILIIMNLKDALIVASLLMAPSSLFLGTASSIDIIMSGKKEPVPVRLNYLYGQYFGPYIVNGHMVDASLLAGIAAVMVSIACLLQHLNQIAGWFWLLFGIGHICLARLLDQLRKKKLPPSKVAMNIALLLAICPPTVFALFMILS